MALIQLNYVSNALQRMVSLQVILPVDKLTDDGTLPPEKKYKTLYLLHGYTDNQINWLSGSRIQRWAEERDLCVVMPAGDNSFYIDRPETNNNYGKFIGEELVDVTRRMFPLSRKREDTFIGGLSMGGFGAMRNGLKYHDTFGAIICFSGVLQIFEHINDVPSIPDRKFMEGVFGDPEEAAKSDKNPTVLVKELANSGKAIPNIYMACGTEDFLLHHSREFRKLLEDHNIPVTYEESAGEHNWDFWDTYIKKALDWLPLDEPFKGLVIGSNDK